MELPLSPALSISNLQYLKHKNFEYFFVHDGRQVGVVVTDGSSPPTPDTSTHSHVLSFADFEDDFDNSIVFVRPMKIGSSNSNAFFLAVSSHRRLKVFQCSDDTGQFRLVNTIQLNQKAPIVGLEQITTSGFILASATSLQTFQYKHSKEFVQSSKHSIEDSSITCISSDGTSGLLTVETSGLALWKASDKKTVSLKRFPLPVNCKAVEARLLPQWILIGTVSGQIQLVSRDSGKLHCEIQAHCTAITSMDIFTNKEYSWLLSSSEDHFMRLFRLKLDGGATESTEVSFETQIHCENLIPTGVRVFESKTGLLCAVSCFEKIQIELIKISEV